MYRPGWDEPVPTLVSAFQSLWSFARFSSGAPSSASWEATTARMIYVPVAIPRQVLVKAMWWVNGSFNNAEGIEAGIYRDTGGYQPGAKVASTGIITQGTADQLQIASLSGGTVVLTPGTYWLALGATAIASTADVTFFRNSSSASMDAFHKYYETATPGSWPSTATPLESTSNAAWLFGIVTTAYPL